MFWGLKMEPGRSYEQTVQQSFHVSMACIEMNNSDNDFVPVMLDMHNQQYILCYLHKNKAFQCQLNLNFRSGDKVVFYSSGKSTVHLTGYLIEPDNIDYSLDLVSSEEEEKIVTEVYNFSSNKRRNEPQETKQQVKKPKIKDDGDDDDDCILNGVEVLYMDKDSDSDSPVSAHDDDDDDDDDFKIGESSLEEDNDSDEDSDYIPGTKVASEPKKEKLNKSLQEEQNTPNKEQSKKKKKKKEPNEKAQAGSRKTPSSANKVNGTPTLLSSKKRKKENETPGKSGQAPGSAGSSAKKIRPHGVIIEDIKVGDGELVTSGKRVTVYNVGRLKHFEATTHGPGFKIQLGNNEVIKGWHLGIWKQRITSSNSFK